MVYGGVGTPDILRDGWRIPGHAAFVLRPERVQNTTEHGDAP